MCVCGFGYGRVCCSVFKRKLNGWRVEEKVRVCVDVTRVDRALLVGCRSLLAGMQGSFGRMWSSFHRNQRCVM